MILLVLEPFSFYLYKEDFFTQNIQSNTLQLSKGERPNLMMKKTRIWVGATWLLLFHLSVKMLPITYGNQL